MIHGSDCNKDYSNPNLIPYFENSIKAADFVLVSGPQIKESIQKKIHPSNRIHCIYNHIQTDIFQPGLLPDKKLSRNALSWSNKFTHILTVANIRKEKGIDILLRSINMLGKTPTKPLHFHIIGRQSNDHYQDEIENLIRAVTTDNVKITLHSSVPRENLIDFYKACDFFVLPSRSEGFNVSLLEAISIGRPVISTDTGGASQLIDKSNGIITETENCKKLAEAIQVMSNSYHTYNPSELHQKIKMHYSFGAYSEKLQELYDQLTE